jgi:hypothetical protein
MHTTFRNAIAVLLHPPHRSYKQGRRPQIEKLRPLKRRLRRSAGAHYLRLNNDRAVRYIVQTNVSYGCDLWYAQERKRSVCNCWCTRMHYPRAKFKKRLVL